MERPNTKVFEPSVEISLAMITRNEVDVIKIALNSIKDYVDEIIIVDAESTDGTIDKAKQFTDKVIISPWENNFAKQRNIAISHCTKPYVFMLDADETITPDFGNKLKMLLRKYSDVDLFSFPRCNTIVDLDERPYLVTKYGWTVDGLKRVNYPDIQGRLFKREENIKWEGVVHERITGAKKHIIIEGMDIIHTKNWLRQTSQNNYYDELTE